MGLKLTQSEKAQRIKDYDAEVRRNKGHRTARDRARVILPPQDGCVFVLSDEHYYPGDPESMANKAALALAWELHPWAIISNGDAIDGASISRWPVGSFSELGARPTVFAELEATAIAQREFEALPFVQWCVWNLGNHDARFETRLAEKVPEYAGVNGFTLKEHFPGWLPAWATWIGDEVIIKHRFKGGMHAAQNNALWAGRSMFTGHTHRLRNVPLTDYNGTRWGGECGTMSPIDSKHFLNYAEDNPANWQQGFNILHFQDGRFIGPEPVHVLPDGRVPFRGELLDLT